MPPRPSAASFTAAWHDSVLVTSHVMANVPGPASLAAPSSLSCRRASRAACAPRWASPMPMQRPSPLEAPTTTVRNVPPLTRLTAVLDIFHQHHPAGLVGPGRARGLVRQARAETVGRG